MSDREQPDLSEVEAALVDLDGTVLHGGRVIDGAREGLQALQAADIEVCFLTNNPTRTPQAWAERLENLGIPTEPSSVLTSMTATVAYLRDYHADAHVYPIAGDAVVAQLSAGGFDVVDDWQDADVVVAGYDETFDYDDMTAGLRAMHDGIPLVGIDPDRWVPTDEGPIPGSGAIINAVAGAAQRDPEAVLGKPSPVTADIALSRLGVAPHHCLLVGDRLDTDVEMGGRAGMHTALVLTGASTREEVEDASFPPEFILADLGALAELTF